MTRRAFLIAATLMAAFFSTPADAARCPQGYIYRPSKAICQYKPAYAKQTRVRHYKQVRVSNNRSRIRHRLKRERPVKPVRSAPVMRAKATSSPPTPMWYFLEPNPFKSPYGRLVVMLQNYDQNLEVWARMRVWSFYSE
jgi:hypothetical protein